MQGRKIVALATLGAVVATVAVTAGSVSAIPGPLSHDEPHVIDVLGVEDFEANALVYSTFRFDPGTVRAHPGERVRLIDRDRSANAPHSLTVVRRRDLAQSFDELFACEPCNVALDRHFSSDPPAFKVNVGRPGLDQPGDSLLIFPDQAIGSVVSADPNTSLWFVCAFHPWMQGRIKVG